MAGFVGDSRRLKGRQEELQNGQTCKVKATRRWDEQVNLQNERFASTKQQCYRQPGSKKAPAKPKIAKTAVLSTKKRGS